LTQNSTVPANAAKHAEELAPMKRAQIITGMSRTYIYGHLDDETNPFPRPIKIGSRSLWPISELYDWVNRQVMTNPRAETGTRMGKRMGSDSGK